jgi:hypothetical protein
MKHRNIDDHRDIKRKDRKSMDKDKLRAVLGAVIQHIDYDMWKNKYNEETVEYGEDVDTNFEEIIDVAEEILEQE